MSDILFFNYARSALYFGIKNLLLSQKKQHKKKILVPSYICNTVIQPLKDNDLEIIFYDINYNLSTNWKNLESKIDENIFAIMFVNYFGILNNVDKYLSLKKKYNFFLIEDSSHGYYGIYNQYKVGTIGDISILSPRKNIHLQYGGVLKLNCKNYINKEYLKIKKESFSLKSFLNYYLSNNFYQKKIKLKKILRFNFYNNFVNNEFDENVIYKRLDFFSEITIKKYNWKRNAEIRMKNYNLWLEFSLKNNFDIPFKNSLEKENQLTPWCFPILTKSEIQKKKIIQWTIDNDFLAFTWTSLPKNAQDPVALYLSKYLICFSTYSNPSTKINDKV